MMSIFDELFGDIEAPNRVEVETGILILVECDRTEGE